MEWIYLIIAGISEIAWAYGLKMSHGFTNIEWSIATIIMILFSFFLFARSLKAIPMGTAYAVFTGIGAFGTAIIGIIFLDESVNPLKIISLIMLISGIIGLKLVDKKKEEEEK